MNHEKILENLIERTTTLENELRNIKAKQLNIEVGKFYEFEGERIFITSEFSKPIQAIGFNDIYHTLPLFNIMHSNGKDSYLSEEDLVLLKPWDFKGQQPTIFPAIGKWYKNKNGSIDICKENTGLSFFFDFPFIIFGSPYNAFGEKHIGLFQPKYDLIEEVPEPKEEKVRAPISLEVDSFWKTRDGKKVYIFHIDDDGDFHGVSLNDDTILYYDADGSYYDDCDHSLDIVAKWEE